MRTAPTELRGQLARGALLAFPVTPFADDGAVDVQRLRDHVGSLLVHRPDAVFACGGTGEFASLTFGEWRAVVDATVREVAGRVPVLAGCGYGTATARELRRAAEDLGCDGVLVLPPYLAAAGQEGLYGHYAAIARDARIAMVVYQRDHAVFAPETAARLAELPAIAGFKDGVGNVERLQRVALATGGRMPLINGLPTAEMSQLALGAVGAAAYSSAVFNFVPELARRFYDAWRTGDRAEAHALLASFYGPFCALRDRRPGYAVALVKAGVGLRQQSCGPVRSPLCTPDPADLAALRELLRANGVPVAG